MTRTIALLLGLLTVLPLQAQTVEAQATDQASTTQTQPRNAMAVAPVYRSALGGYRAFQDEKVSSWQASNDNVARIGGWRVYAREAREPEPAPRDTVRAAPAAAGHPHAGHGK